MPLVAREGTTINHNDGSVGTVVINGERTVYAENKRVAVAGDTCDYHGGTISSVSTVYADGKPIARVGDTTSCSSPGTLSIGGSAMNVHADDGGGTGGGGA